MKNKNDIAIESLASINPIFKLPKVKIYVSETVDLILNTSKGEKQNAIFLIATPGIFLLSKKIFKKKLILNNSIPFIDITSIHIANQNISFKSQNSTIRVSTPKATSIGTLVYFIKQVLFPISLCPITLNLDSNTLKFDPSTFPYEAQDIFYERFLSCIMKYEITNIPPIIFKYPNLSNNYNNGIFLLKKEHLSNPLFQPLMLSLAFEEQTKELEINDDISISQLFPQCSTFFSLNKFIKRVTFINPDFTNAKSAFESSFSVPRLFKPRELLFKYCNFVSNDDLFFESLSKICSEFTSLEFIHCNFDKNSIHSLFEAINSNDYFHSIECLHFTDIPAECCLFDEIDKLCQSRWLNMSQSLRKICMVKCDVDASLLLKSFLFNETGVKIISFKQCPFVNELSPDYEYSQSGGFQLNENENNNGNLNNNENDNLNRNENDKNDNLNSNENNNVNLNNDENNNLNRNENDKNDNLNSNENNNVNLNNNENNNLNSNENRNDNLNNNENSNGNLNNNANVNNNSTNNENENNDNNSDPNKNDNSKTVDQNEEDHNDTNEISNPNKITHTQTSHNNITLNDKPPTTIPIIHSPLTQAHIQTHKLKELDLEGCTFTQSSILSLFTFLTKELITISRLNLSFMKIDESDFNTFITRISDFSLPSLKMFAFNANTMNSNQLDSFDDFLLKQRKLKALFLNGSITVDENDRKSLKKLLKIVTMMDINQIGLRGAGTSKYDFGRHLTKFLKNLSLKGTVLSLDVTNQSFTSEGVDALILLLNTTPIQEFFFDGISVPDFDCFLNLCEEVVRSDLKVSAWPFNECERLLSSIEDQIESEKVVKIMEKLEMQFIAKFGSNQPVFDLSKRPKLDTSVFREKKKIELQYFRAVDMEKREECVVKMYKECADTEKYFYEEPILKVLAQYEKAISFEKLAKFKK